MIVSVVLIAWATTLRVVNGQESFSNLETTYGAVIAFYFLGGVVSGAILGALRPLMRSRAGLALAVVLAAAPLTVALRVMWSGFTPWTQVDWLFLVIFPTACGLITFLVSLTE